MANQMSISRRIAMQGGRLPVDQGSPRVVGPVWMNLAATYTPGAAASLDLTTAAAFNGSQAIRSVFSNTGSAPEAILHIEAISVYMTGAGFHDGTTAQKAQWAEQTFVKSVIGGTQTSYDSLRCIHEPYSANSTTAAATTVNRYTGSGVLLLPTPLRVDVQDDQLTFEVPNNVAFAGAFNFSVCLYGWAFPRTYFDGDDLSEGTGCGPGTVGVARAAKLQERFYNQLGVPLMG